MPRVFLLCPTHTNSSAFHTKSTSAAPTNADSSFGLFLTGVSSARPARPDVNAIGRTSNFLFSIVLVNVFIRTGKTVQARGSACRDQTIIGGSYNLAANAEV